MSKRSYDANGNRTGSSGTTTYTASVSTTNNQLNSTSGGMIRTYTYDAAGNTQTYTGETFTFNQRGRMSSATSSAGTTNYVYNALGQLIEKSGIGGTTLLMYDEAGHTLGEYSNTGALIEETIWMGDIPVATLRPSGSTVTIYYVHANHLGAPVKVTRPSDNGLMWRWDPDTFGSSTSTPNGNPSGFGTFVYNLRFPGQYALTESGLSYNYFRTYDPATGRYIESDPIGLAGGSYSTYAYVGGNPISNIDPLGLYLRVIGNTPAEQTALQDALNVVASTQRGSQLISALQNSPDLYVIANRGTNNAYFLNQIISVDPNFHPKIHTTCGNQEAPTSIILGHEIGHAVRNDLPPKNLTDEWNDVLENENPIRQQLGLPLRTSY